MKRLTFNSIQSLCGRASQLALSLGLATTLGSTAAVAGPRDVAYKIFNRINGVPPSAEALAKVEAKVAAGDLKGAALEAINDNGGMFYNLTLKNMASRWSNAEATPRAALNDFVATVIGMVRDDVAFNTVLSADVLYTGTVAGAPAYSLANNDHYVSLETGFANLKDVLVKQTQSGVTGGLPAEATAGVMTTRGFAEAYYKAGTNRRAVAFTLANFLCKDMEQLMDTTRSDMKVRRDVTRAPGGDTSLFKNRCAGCHAGMDAFGDAFAHYDWDDTTAAGTFIFTPDTVREKMLRNATEFPQGHRTEDDSWENMWLEGQNAVIGWNGAPSGNGAKTLGEALTATDAFAQCMVRHSFNTVCLRAPGADDADAVQTLADDFSQNAYKMKDLFAGTAAYCLK